jgi:hypothetical protein
MLRTDVLLKTKELLGSLTYTGSTVGQHGRERDPHVLEEFECGGRTRSTWGLSYNESLWLRTSVERQRDLPLIDQALDVSHEVGRHDVRLQLTMLLYERLWIEEVARVEQHMHFRLTIGLHCLIELLLDGTLIIDGLELGERQAPTPHEQTSVRTRVAIRLQVAHERLLTRG